MLKNYSTKDMSAGFTIWLNKVDKIAKHKYDIDIENYTPDYNFKELYEANTSPREVVAAIAAKVL